MVSCSHHGLKFQLIGCTETQVDTEVMILSYFVCSMVIIKPNDEKVRAASHQAYHTMSLHALPKTLGLCTSAHTVHETTPHSIATRFAYAHLVTKWCAAHSTRMTALDKTSKILFK